MDTNSNLTDTRRELAITYIADIFSEALCVRNRSLLESENLCIEQGHTILTRVWLASDGSSNPRLIFKVIRTLGGVDKN